MSEPHEHEIEVFNVALELPAGERAAYLEVACAGDPALRERFLFSVFVSCDEAERLARRVERDVRERGRTPDSVKRQFLAHVRPMHDLFVEPQRDLADAILQSPAPPDRLAALKHDLLQRAGLPETRRNAAA